MQNLVTEFRAKLQQEKDECLKIQVERDSIQSKFTQIESTLRISNEEKEALTRRVEDLCKSLTDAKQVKSDLEFEVKDLTS